MTKLRFFFLTQITQSSQLVADCYLLYPMPRHKKNYSMYSHQVFVVSQSVTPASFAPITSSFGFSIR
jgi:hypothetical protein